jgi:hypothetical protein
MNKGMKMIQNILHFLLFNSSRFHYLEPPRKEVIATMVDLVEFWIIQESELVQHAT